MALFNNKSNYPPVHVNGVDYMIERYVEVTQEMQYNPVKTAIIVYGSYQDAELIWLVNNIKNPFKELRKGMFLKIPSIKMSSAAELGTTKPKPVTVKNAKINGQKLIF